MNPGGSGPYVRPSREVPGIEAGCSPISESFQIGTVSFVNVSINAACVLPFNNARATFVASIGREDRPVLLSIAPYAGEGSSPLCRPQKLLSGFAAASFEFGGGGAFKYGPLSGQGRICTGIYLRKVGDDCLIEGFFLRRRKRTSHASRSARHSWCASAIVRAAVVQGSAIFTFSFSVGFAASVSSRRAKEHGAGFFWSLRATSAMRTAEVAFAPEEGRLPSCAAAPRGQQGRLVAYQTYFASDIVGFPS